MKKQKKIKTIKEKQLKQRFENNFKEKSEQKKNMDGPSTSCFMRSPCGTRLTVYRTAPSNEMLCIGPLLCLETIYKLEARKPNILKNRALTFAQTNFKTIYTI